MKTFALEFETKPCRTFRLQKAETLASVALMAENGKLPLVSVRELNGSEEIDYERGGARWGLQAIITP